jgi:hypothetical protein
VANAQLKVVGDPARDFAQYIVTVDVTNRGTGAQPPDTRQHLDVLRGGEVLGSQPIPVLGPKQAYAAAFRMRLPRGSTPLRVTFRYVLDSHNAPRANCTTVNDRLTATLG